jgi:hypothetical protein
MLSEPPSGREERGAGADASSDRVPNRQRIRMTTPPGAARRDAAAAAEC